MESKKRKYLGYANGWNKTPEKLEQCREKEHNMGSYREANCVTVYVCDLCNIYYKIDSSG